MTKVYDVVITGKRISQVYDTKVIETHIKNILELTKNQFNRDLVHFDINVKVTEIEREESNAAILGAP